MTEPTQNRWWEEEFDKKFCFDSLIFKPDGESYVKTLYTNRDQTRAIRDFIKHIEDKAVDKERQRTFNYLVEYHSNMKEELKKNPGNEYVKGGIRVLTLAVRHFQALTKE